MNQTAKETTTPEKKVHTKPVISAVLPDGSLLEALYRPDEHRTLFCVGTEGVCRYEASVIARGQQLVPYSPNNNLLRNRVVLLPTQPEEFVSEEQLIADIQSFIHRYVDVSPLFEKIASYYVLLSWVYDGFNELPYLRLLGNPGSGKTRFLLIVGSLCYKPIFASGASTVSPLFRILDIVRGTLIIDEGDFRVSDERAEIIKILNNGNAKGFPVLRSEVVGKEYNPHAYAVFGPKLVATRGLFQDRALESRCLTEEMGHVRLRDDVPINLPSNVQDEACHLRNQLLLFRFRNLHKCKPAESLVDRSIEPRLNQIFVPLLSIIKDPQARSDLQEMAKRYNREMIADRGMDTEAQVLEVIYDMLNAPDARLSIRDITSWFIDRHVDDYERKITAKWIGGIVRRKLQLKAVKSNGVYVIPEPQYPKLRRLFERYGIGSKDSESVEDGQSSQPK